MPIRFRLPTNGTVPGWRWVHTPGHTFGHVSFLREHDRVLVVGDAFKCLFQMKQPMLLTQLYVIE